MEHGCKVIQVDEPVLMRKPQEAIDYGIKDLAACFKGMLKLEMLHGGGLSLLDLCSIYKPVYNYSYSDRSTL